MKNHTAFILTLLLICLNAGHLFSQGTEFSVVRISRISYIHNHSGAIKEQLEINPETNTIYYRKNIHRKFTKIKTDLSISLFSDSIKMDRVKQISKSIAGDSEECRYHNEYGYFRIELLKFSGEDQIYSEHFLINQPYECQNESDQVIVRTYYNLITSLFKET